MIAWWKLIYINYAETKVGGWRWVTSRPFWPATGP